MSKVRIVIIGAGVMAGRHLDSILSHGACSLPTLQESYSAHEFILSALFPTANLLLNKQDEIISVT